MKIWKTVAQNVLSGIVGGLLVMSSAEAQKPAIKPVLFEVKTHKLTIVDDNNKVCGELSAFGGSPCLHLKTNGSFVHLGTSDRTGSSLMLGEKKDCFLSLDVSGAESGLKFSNGKYAGIMTATNANAALTMIKTDSRDMIAARVEDGITSLVANGGQSRISVGNARGKTFGQLDYGIRPGMGSVSVYNGGGLPNWVQPPF